MLTSSNQCSICLSSHATGEVKMAHNNKCCAAQWKVLNGPQLGRGPPLCTLLGYSLNNWISHWCKVLSFHWTTLVSDARYTGYYRRGLRIRFYMIEYRLFYFCTVKGYNTGLKQWCDWRGFKGANLRPDKINAKTESPFCLYFGIQ